MRGKRFLATIVLVLALVAAAACGDDSGKKASTPTTPTTGGSKLTASFRGVTADSIKVGIVMVDFKSIAQYVDETHGDQKKIYQALIDDVNAKGGVLGRKLVPVYKEYVPIDPNAANGSLPLCTYFAEDQKVFAVLGVYIDFSGGAQLCLTRDHDTIHIGHELDESMIQKSKQGLLLTNDRTADRSTDILLNVLGQEKTLAGKTVAIMADSERAAGVKAVEKQLDTMGVKRGASAVLAIAGEDTAQAQSQLDGFLERWRSQKVDALVVLGQKSVAEQFITKVKAKFPDMLLVLESDSSARSSATKLKQAGTTPNPYEGAIVVQGLSEHEQFVHPSFQRCKEAYEKRTGDKIVDPADWKPGANGKIAKVFVAVRDACDELTVLTEIAKRAGPNLTNASWIDAVDNFGEISIPAQIYSSFRKGKYEADDGARLAAWDTELGDYRAITKMVDTGKG
jgi:hypothetical protein